MKLHQRHKPPIGAIITLLLLFLTGQVMALAYGSAMNAQDQPQTMSQDCGHMEKQIQSSTDNNVMNHANMATMSDCCETLCQCPQALCATVLLLPVKTQSTPYFVDKSFAHWVFADGFHLNKDQSPLYRPPII